MKEILDRLSRKYQRHFSQALQPVDETIFPYKRSKNIQAPFEDESLSTPHLLLLFP
jgi:hypothetical protein